MGVMVNPPKPGDISYLKFAAERLSILSLKIFTVSKFLRKNKPTQDTEYLSLYILNI
jgi:hypothetical protein